MKNCLRGIKTAFLARPPAMSSVLNCLFEFISRPLFSYSLEIKPRTFCLEENKKTLNRTAKCTQGKARALKRKFISSNLIQKASKVVCSIYFPTLK